MSRNSVNLNLEEDFVVLIISHGRPNYYETWNCLKRSGYTGRKVVIIDNLDKSHDWYLRNFGTDNVFVFNKIWQSKASDRMNTFNDMRATLYVRNACWDIARELGFKYFLVLDDDYGSFCHKREECEKTSKRLNEVFSYFVEYLANTPIKCIAFSQGGDHIGGYKDAVLSKRKIMNSFFCLTSRPFKFYGIMNDDVNAYLHNGAIGDIYITYMPFQLDQIDTQKEKGGMTEAYELSGTYVKSFYSIMIAPNAVKIKLMGEKSQRLHHSISWGNTCPCIINYSFKK